MRILIDGKEVVPKEDFSFEYTAENRLFRGRDGYTMSISFPIYGCPQNVKAFGYTNRIEIRGGQKHYDCLISDKNCHIEGVLSIVKVKGGEVDCQFAEGKCAQTMTDPLGEIYICDLDLGSPIQTDAAIVAPAQAWKSIDDGAESVALPFINSAYPETPNNWVTCNVGTKVYSWNSEIKKIAWQPYLLTIAERVCEAMGYTPDFSAWRSSWNRHLIICNCLPAEWDRSGYADALPRWTVTKFFEEIELLLVCEFDFDHIGKTVVMTYSADAISNAGAVSIDNVLDEYISTYNDEGSDCEYLPVKGLKYADGNGKAWKYQACDWLMNTNPTAKEYDTLASLVDRNSRRTILDEAGDGGILEVSWGELVGPEPTLMTTDAILYAKDEDTYYAMRPIGEENYTMADGATGTSPVYVLEAVNIFGSSRGSDDGETVDIVPVSIVDTYVSQSNDRGYMMELSPSGSNGDDGSESLGTEITKKIEAGAPESKGNVYDQMYVAFWNGHKPDPNFAVYPAVDGRCVCQNWRPSKWYDSYSLRLDRVRKDIPQVDASRKLSISWVGDTIPNPRAIFYIKGVKCICEKITATFTGDGMSQLLKGEFWPAI